MPGVGPSLGYFTNLIGWIGAVIAAAVPVLVALALLLFLWGLVKFIFASGDESAVEEGKRRMLWGIIALFVIVSVWGLVALLSQLTGVHSVTPPNTPFYQFT